MTKRASFLFTDLMLVLVAVSLKLLCEHIRINVGTVAHSLYFLIVGNFPVAAIPKKIEQNILTMPFLPFN